MLKSLSSWSCQILYFLALSLFHASPSFAVTALEAPPTNEINTAAAVNDAPNSAPLQDNYGPLNGCIVCSGVFNLGLIATIVTLGVIGFSSEHAEYYLCDGYDDTDPYCTHELGNTTEIIRIPNDRLPNSSICDVGTCYCEASSTDFFDKDSCDLNGYAPLWASIPVFVLSPFTLVTVGGFIYLLCYRFSRPVSPSTVSA